MISHDYENVTIPGPFQARDFSTSSTFPSFKDVYKPDGSYTALHYWLVYGQYTTLPHYHYATHDYFIPLYVLYCVFTTFHYCMSFFF